MHHVPKMLNRSFRNKVIRRGPSTEPWEMPLRTGKTEEDNPLAQIYIAHISNIVFVLEYHGQFYQMLSYNYVEWSL